MRVAVIARSLPRRNFIYRFDMFAVFVAWESTASSLIFSLFSTSTCGAATCRVWILSNLNVSRKACTKQNMPEIVANSESTLSSAFETTRSHGRAQ